MVNNQFYIYRIGEYMFIPIGKKMSKKVWHDGFQSYTV